MRRWNQFDTPATIFSIAQTGVNEWIAGTTAGLWRLRDGTFTQIAEPLKATMLTAVAGQDGRLFVGAGDGMAYSDDDGATWTASALPLVAQGQPQISQIVLSPNFVRDEIAFAATPNNGVLRTTDRAVSWKYKSFGLADQEVTAIAMSPTYSIDGTTLAAVLSGLFVSTLGERWKLLPFDKEALPISAIAFARNALIVGSESKGLYHSTNRGETWSKRGAFNSGPINVLAVSPDGTKIAVANPMVAAWSTDFGETWERTEGKTPKNIIALSIDDSGTLVCGTQQDGLWVY
jgi:WD40 repeat protein